MVFCISLLDGSSLLRGHCVAQQPHSNRIFMVCQDNLMTFLTNYASDF